MTNAILVIGLLGLLGGASVFGDLRRNWLVIIMATFGWFLMAGWSMATSEETWDAYWIIAIMSVGMAIITSVWPLTHRPHELPKEDDLTEEDRAWGGRRRRRPRSRWSEEEE